MLVVAIVLGILTLVIAIDIVRGTAATWFDSGEWFPLLNEQIEIGLFAAEPGRDTFDAKNVIVMERQPIHSGRQVLYCVSDRKPTHAGIDPYNFYIDRKFCG